MTLNSEQRTHYEELMRLRDEVCAAYHYNRIARTADQHECSCALMRARFRFDEKVKELLSLIPTKEPTA